MTFATVDGVALITGAGAGIGEETGYAFAEAGASGVVFADINYENALANAEKSKAHATNPNYRAISTQVDVSSPESVQAIVDLTVQEFGRIDYSVNSAGLGATSLLPTQDVDIKNFDGMFEVNTKGVMLCVRAVCKAMMAQDPRIHKGRHGKERTLGRGCIVNLASAASYLAAPHMMAYVASKHAVLGITKVASLDMAKHNIRVTAVCPAYVNTPMFERSKKRVPGLEKMIAAASPTGKAADPEEVANVVVFLCSPSASYVSGTGIIIDQGVSVSARI
ncbi:hypothetical protein HYFRA_00011044 [Hymenoscyphus fraxineus]|uniref:NAD(P)-binding protein n=1 Tax=Hymenoscyphus fraxineus TaxID=746836 RepID=A0A9N9L6D0_9HELO|nr:hypothetical protein HYFRA_00011044 [Hymenoscyphus fraxineus]